VFLCNLAILDIQSNHEILLNLDFLQVQLAQYNLEDLDILCGHDYQQILLDL
jgi:hypothetical protein